MTRQELDAAEAYDARMYSEGYNRGLIMEMNRWLPAVKALLEKTEVNDANFEAWDALTKLVSHTEHEIRVREDKLLK